MKRRQGRSTIHFTADSENIELIMRTIRSASQLSIYEAVSSWCIERSGRIQGQESTGVIMFISQENDKLSQQLNPQEVGSLARSSPRTKGAAGNCWQDLLQRFQMMTSEEHLRSPCEETGFVRTVSRGMCYKTGEDVDDGFAIFLHHAENTPFLGPIQILKQNFGYTSTQRLVLFLMSKLSVNTTFVESRCRSPQQLETAPMFGWSYPEAEIVTWMSYATENQKIFLKKLFKNLVSRTRERAFTK